jgi:hypothetical protein
MIVAKILTTASKLYNLSHHTSPDYPEIKDTLATMHFYVDILMQRYNISPLQIYATTNIINTSPSSIYSHH